MTVPYLLRFCPFRALMCMLFGIHTQGVASLTLGYALIGLSARSNHRVSLRMPWAAFSPLCLNQKRIFIVYILLFVDIISLLNYFVECSIVVTCQIPIACFQSL